MSDDYYPGPAEDRITEFTRARAAEVRAELVAISDSMATLPSLDDMYFNRLGYAAATGTADALILNLNPAPSAYIDGMGLTVKLASTNTGPATVNVNGLGVKALRRPDGSALSSGDLQAGALVNIRYEGTSGQFRVMVGTVTINQAGVDLVISAATVAANNADASATSAANSAAAAATSIAPYTANDVLAKLLTVDGTGSNVDADKVRGTTPGTFGLTLLSSTSLSSARVSLGTDLIDNTSDANKPISTATQTALDLKLNRSGGTMTGALTLAGDPVAALQPATKQYADAISTTVPASGGPAVLATIANDTLSGLAARDGVTPSGGQRVLVTAQTTAAQNGIYLANAGAWTRATDADTFAEMDKMFILVLNGTQAGGWSANNGTGGTLGTTPIVWQRVSIQASNTASNGVTKSGNDFQLSPMAANSIKGNATGASAIPTDLTGTQVAALIPVFSNVTKGLVPAAAVATNAYLRADATFTSSLTPTSLAASGTVTGSNLSGTNTGDQTITLTGAVTGGGVGTFATTLTDNIVTNSKLADMATATFKGRTTAGTGDPEDMSVAQAKALLNLSGTNTGDQTKESLGLGAANNVTFQDVSVSRGNGTGYIFFAGLGTRYMGYDGNVYVFNGAGLFVDGNITAANFSGSHSGTSSGTNTGDQTSVSGNAGTATALQTPRTISISGAVYSAGASFNGTGNINLAITGLDVGLATSGTLTVARGGTGVTTSTGSGSVVLNASPNLTGTTTVAAITASGAINGASIYSSGALSAYSDARLKTDVATIEDALAKVNRMRGVTFTRKSDGRKSSGVIAQEQLAEAPELVGADEDGMLHYEYGATVGYLIEAIKTLTAKVEQLEARA